QNTQSTGVAYRPPKSISSFVAGFKSSATKHINELRETPKFSVWQTRFHDHIIRNDAEYLRINKYIENNPQNWGNDKFFKTEEV
ncbi:MAG: transposase, partial [Bacteroidota bacterium]